MDVERLIVGEGFLARRAFVLPLLVVELHVTVEGAPRGFLLAADRTQQAFLPVREVDVVDDGLLGRFFFPAQIAGEFILMSHQVHEKLPSLRECLVASLASVGRLRVVLLRVLHKSFVIAELHRASDAIDNFFRLKVVLVAGQVELKFLIDFRQVKAKRTFQLLVWILKLLDVVAVDHGVELHLAPKLEIFFAHLAHRSAGFLLVVDLAVRAERVNRHVGEAALVAGEGAGVIGNFPLLPRLLRHQLGRFVFA